MKIRNLIPILLLCLALCGCTATVAGSVADPAAATGTVQEDAALIGEEQAKAIALQHADLTEADVTRLRVEYEIDDGVKQYDVEFHHGEYEYEYEINATSGAILSADKDRED